MSIYSEKFEHVAVYTHELTEPKAEPCHVDHWKAVGLSLVVISAGSMVGLVLIVVAKLLEGR